MTANQISVALFWQLCAASELIVPRHTPPHWWECDVWRLSKSGFWMEYEIKLTIEDFRKDFSKKQDVISLTRGGPWRTPIVERKHDLLAAKDARGPSRFWFVVPFELAGKIDIPPYAGLLAAHAGGRSVSSLTIVVQAPLLHRIKWVGNKETLLSAFYWRFWRDGLRYLQT